MHRIGAMLFLGQIDPGAALNALAWWAEVIDLIDLYILAGSVFCLILALVLLIDELRHGAQGAISERAQFFGLGVAVERTRKATAIVAHTMADPDKPSHRFRGLTVCIQHKGPGQLAGCGGTEVTT